MNDVIHKLHLDKQGRVQIPIHMRKVLNIYSEDEIVSWLEDGRLIMEPRQSFIKRIRAKYRGSGHEVDDFIAERREEAQQET